MKNLINLLCVLLVMLPLSNLKAQDLASESNEIPTDYLTRNPIYDYSEAQLNNTDSIPDFETKADKLMISGTIYQSDGVTPAKDVILYISQPDEDGDYVLKTKDDKRYVHHRGWVKTDADGKYTFYTFMPGNFWKNREVKHIHPVIKEPGKAEQEMMPLLFDNDPFLGKACRKKMAKKGLEDNILKIETENGMMKATKNFVLEGNASTIK